MYLNICIDGQTNRQTDKADGRTTDRLFYSLLTCECKGLSTLATGSRSDRDPTATLSTLATRSRSDCDPSDPHREVDSIAIRSRSVESN